MNKLLFDKYYMKKLFIIFFIMVCAFSKNGYASMLDEENKEIKNLQSHISSIPINSKPVIFLDCFLIYKSDEEKTIINRSNHSGYELEKVQYDAQVESIQSAFHDSSYSTDLRAEDHQQISNTGSKVVLKPVIEIPEKIEFLKFCLNRAQNALPIPHFNLIDYPGFLAWSLDTDVYMTAVIRKSRIQYADIKVYCGKDGYFKGNEQEIESALHSLIQHLTGSRRKPKLEGFQLEASEKDKFSTTLAENLMLSRSNTETAMGIKRIPEEAYRMGIGGYSEVPGYRYYRTF